MNDLVTRGSKTAKDGFKNENDVIDSVMDLLPFYNLILRREIKLKYISLKYLKELDPNYKPVQIEVPILMPIKEYNDFVLRESSISTTDSMLMYNPQLIIYKNAKHFKDVSMSFFNKIQISIHFKNCVKNLSEIINDFALFQKSNLLDLLFCKLDKALCDFGTYKQYQPERCIDEIFNNIDTNQNNQYPIQFRKFYSQNIIDIKNKYVKTDTVGKFIKNVRGNILHTSQKINYNIQQSDLEQLIYNALHLLILELNEEIGLHNLYNTFN